MAAIYIQSGIFLSELTSDEKSPQSDPPSRGDEGFVQIFQELIL